MQIVICSAQVLLVLWSTHISPCYEVVDLFSGIGNIARRYREAGLGAAEYDFIHDDRAMNILTAAGFGLLAQHSACPETSKDDRKATHLKQLASEASDLLDPEPGPFGHLGPRAGLLVMDCGFSGDFMEDPCQSPGQHCSAMGARQQLHHEPVPCWKLSYQACCMKCEVC